MTFQPLFPIYISLIVAIALVIICALQIVKVTPREYDSTKLTWVRRLIMVLLLFVISLGPSIQSIEEKASISNLDILFVVDNSGSMSAIDGNQEGRTRLDIAKEDIKRLSYTLPPSKYAAIVFNSVASVQLPFTQDVRALRTFADTITPEITQYSNGSDFSSPISVISDTLNRMYQNYPNEKALVIYMSDGEQVEGDFPDYKDLDQRVFGGVILGYGTSDGAEMIDYTPELSGILDLAKVTGDDSVVKSTTTEIEKHFIVDPDTSQPAISKLSVENLQSIAKDLNLNYKTRERQNDIDEYANSIFVSNWQDQPVYQHKVIWNLLIWPFEIAFGLLILWEVLIQVSLRVSKGVKK